MIFDGSEYFGPFPKPHQIDLYLRLIERHFPLCKYRGSQKKRASPCLNYHMGRCAGACCGKITREEYLKIVEGVRKLLSGRSEELLRDLREKMKGASDAQDFERAARLRDQIAAIEEASVEQRVMEFTEEDRDYIALAPCADELMVVVLQVREGTAPIASRSGGTALWDRSTRCRRCRFPCRRRKSRNARRRPDRRACAWRAAKPPLDSRK